MQQDNHLRTARPSATLTQLLDRRGCPGQSREQTCHRQPQGIPRGHGAGVPSVHRNTQGRSRCPVTPYTRRPGQLAIRPQAISQAFKHQAELSEGSTAVPRPLSAATPAQPGPTAAGEDEDAPSCGRCSPTQPPSPRTKDLPFGTGCAVNKKGEKNPCAAIFSQFDHLKMFLRTWEQTGK